MSERLRPNEFRELRAHHLIALEELVDKFAEKFPGKNLLTTSFSPRQIAAFIADIEPINRKYLMDQGFTEQKMRWYVADGLGRTEEEKEASVRLLHGRYLRFIEWARGNKDGMVRLIPGSDWICKSCFIGNHCREKTPKEDDGDFGYLMVAKRLSSNPAYRNRVFENADGSLEVSVKALFDPEFHKEVKKAWNAYVAKEVLYRSLLGRKQKITLGKWYD